MSPGMQIDELTDFAAAIALVDALLDCFELLCFGDGKLALPDLVALDDLVVGNLDVLLAAELLVLDRGHVLLVEHPEGNVLGRFHGGMKADRDRDQAESDVAAPDGFHAASR